MPMTSARPRIARDTRWLLIVVFAALASLSILARIRFRSPAELSGPIAPVLSQIAPRSPFEDMTASLEKLLATLRSARTLLPIEEPGADGGRSFVAAVRFRDGLAAALSAGASRSETWLATDRGTHLAIARVAAGGVVAGADWAPTNPGQPRFLAAVDVRTGAIAVRPVFISSLLPTTNSRWPAPVWLIAGTADLRPGSFLFTLEGVLAGLTIEIDGAPALVPATLLFAEAQRIMAETRVPGTLGTEVQAMTPAIRVAVGAVQGVVISWVDSSGPTSALLWPGDVVTAIDGRPILSLAEWEAIVDGLAEGQTVTLSAWRSGELLTVEATAAAASPAADRPLGLELRSIRGVGVLVETVGIGSAAEAAGLHRGDLLTLVGTIHAPSAAQARAAFGTAPRDRPMLIGVTRGRDHFVIAVDRRWP